MKITLLALLAFISFTTLGQQTKNYSFRVKNVKSATVVLNDDSGEIPFDEVPNPFEYAFEEGTKWQFILPKDTIKLVLEKNNLIHIDIVREEKNDTIRMRFKVIDKVKKVTFDDNFKKQNFGTIKVEIPAVYELMNVLMAISPTGIKDDNMVYHSSKYHKMTQIFFQDYKNQRAVKIVDSLLKQNQYYELKMDSYAFRFDKHKKIVGDQNYHIINWGNENSISKELLNAMNDFSQKSNFTQFYKSQKTIYKEQITFFEQKLELRKMITWLEKNFPTQKYQSYKVILSPLVYANQSAQNLEDNGFKEAQAHVNFPYFDQTRSQLFPKTYNLTRGNIVFTELNHSFINPEADKYRKQITEIFTDLSIWEEKGKPADFGYKSPMSCFNEYMNWGLVSLYLNDYGNPEDLQKAINYVEERLTDYRGFRKFKEFNTFLLKIYRQKSQQQTISGLYPQIIDWFKNNNH